MHVVCDAKLQHAALTVHASLCSSGGRLAVCLQETQLMLLMRSLKAVMPDKQPSCRLLSTLSGSAQPVAGRPVCCYQVTCIKSCSNFQAPILTHSGRCQPEFLQPLCLPHYLHAGTASLAVASSVCLGAAEMPRRESESCSVLIDQCYSQDLCCCLSCDILNTRQMRLRAMLQLDCPLYQHVDQDSTTQMINRWSALPREGGCESEGTAWVYSRQL